MTRSQYNRWAAAYAKRFGLATEAGLAMLASWWPEVDHGGYSVEQLIKAEVAVAVVNPRFPPDHRAVFFESLRATMREQRRTEAARRAQEAGQAADAILLPMPPQEFRRRVREILPQVKFRLEKPDGPV